MSPRIRQLVWEQARQSFWMIFAVANALAAGIVGQFAARYPNISYTKFDDAVDMADGYVIVSLLFIIFASLATQDRGRDFTLGVPVRWLRLPLPTWPMAIGWTAARLGLGLLAIALAAATRQPFLNGDTVLPWAQTTAYYGAGLFLFHGAVRLAAAWREGAAWGAVLVLAAVLGANEAWLWPLAATFPIQLLGLSVLAGGVGSTFGIALRRHGGILINTQFSLASERAAYASVADIPRFTDGRAAQTWMEWRRAGWLYVAGCAVGIFMVIGGLLLVPNRTMKVHSILDVIQNNLEKPNIEGGLLLFLVPVWCGVLFAAYVGVLDIISRERGVGRFLRVRPLSAWHFSLARHRMILSAAGLVMLMVVLAALAVLWYAEGVRGTSPELTDENSYGITKSSAHSLLRTVAGQLFPATFSYAYDAYEPARAIDLVGSFVLCAAALGAALLMANRFAIAMILAVPTFLLFLELRRYDRLAAEGLFVVAVLLLALLVVWFARTRRINRFTAAMLLCLPPCLLLLEVPRAGNYLAEVHLLHGAAFLLVVFTFWLAVKRGVIGTRAALWSIVGWFTFLLLTSAAPNARFVLVDINGADGLNTYTQGAVMMVLSAVCMVSPVATALGIHARRSGGWRFPNLAGAGWHWNEARGFVRGAALIALLAVALGASWRATVASALKQELALAKSIGVRTDASDVDSVEYFEGISSVNIAPVEAVQFRAKAGVDAPGRRFRLSSDDAKHGTPTDGAVLDQWQPLDTETLAVLAALRPDLEAIVAAVESLDLKRRVGPPAPDVTRNDWVWGQAGVIASGIDQCLIFSVSAVQEGDAASAARGLRAAIKMLRVWNDLRTQATYMTKWRTPVANASLVIEYVLSKISLASEECSALRQALPRTGNTKRALNGFQLESVESFRDRLRWVNGEYTEISFGPGEGPGTVGGLLAGLVGAAIRVPDQYYIEALHTACVETQMHTNCLAGDIRWNASSPSRRAYRGQDEFWSEKVHDLRSIHREIHQTDAAISLLAQLFALEEYRARHGVYPASLDALVPEILPALPIDWTNNGKHKPCGYLKMSDTACRSWACVDGRDDGGSPSRDSVITLNRP